MGWCVRGEEAKCLWLDHRGNGESQLLNCWLVILASTLVKIYNIITCIPLLATAKVKSIKLCTTITELARLCSVCMRATKSRQ